MESSAPAALPPGRNRLGAETSPYLRQHKDNPVHWWAWGAEALAAAAAADRPILLSIGYSACHWCHVMAHESFEDAETAALMNRLFINIKVDREERPDLDAIYQKALALLGEHGGWPLTMFVAPDGRPFWGGTYFPKEAAYGRPSFTEVLTQIDRVWRERRDDVSQQSAALTSALATRRYEQLRDGLSLPLLHDAAMSLLDYIDPEAGGLKGAPKFPMPFVYDFLWRIARHGEGAALCDAVVGTLEHICQGGIYDHVGGGFARYSTDAAWLVPHFEKMLYDNAQLIALLTMVWRDTRAPLFAARVTETVAWLLREMVAENGAFAAALDADSDGEEGAFYVWQAQDIDDLLGADAPAFKAAYDVTPAGNWEGKVILNRAATPFGSVDETHFAECRDVLLQAREARPRPGRDDKALADWNGLTIAALARAGRVFGQPAWIQAAARAFAAVVNTMGWRDAEGRARIGHSWCAGRLQKTALLDDYAAMADAALALIEVTADAAYLQHAQAWVATADALYWDADGLGYFQTAADAESLIVRTKSANDAATPSGNGLMVGVHARLFYITGAADHRTRAGAIAAAFGVEALRAYPHACAILSGFILLEAAVQVVIVGHPQSQETAALWTAALTAPETETIVSVVADPATLPDTHPAAGKGKVDNRATAYVCRGPVCQAPVTEPGTLTSALV